jgi:hypothetical protein
MIWRPTTLPLPRPACGLQDGDDIPSSPRRTPTQPRTPAPSSSTISRSRRSRAIAPHSQKLSTPGRTGTRILVTGIREPGADESQGTYHRLDADAVEGRGGGEGRSVGDASSEKDLAVEEGRGGRKQVASQSFHRLRRSPRGGAQCRPMTLPDLQTAALRQRSHTNFATSQEEPAPCCWARGRTGTFCALMNRLTLDV